jgi:hypothetical protein
VPKGRYKHKTVSQEISADRDAFGAGHDLTINNYYENRQESQKAHTAMLSPGPAWNIPLILAASATIAIGIILLGAFFSPAPESGIILGSLSLAESRGSYELIVPISSRQSMGEQVEEISLDIQWSCNLAVPGPPPHTYAVDGNVKVLGGNVIEGRVISEANSSGSEYVQAAGSLLDDGCGDTLKLAFRPPALMLSSQAIVPISIVMPERNTFTFTKVTEFDGSISPEPSGRVQIPNFFANPRINVIASLAIKGSFGVQTTSCVIAAPNSTCLRQGHQQGEGTAAPLPVLGRGTSYAPGRLATEWPGCSP